GKGREGGPSPLAIMAVAAATVAIVWYLGRALYWAFYYCVTIPWLTASIAVIGVGIGIITHESALVFVGLVVAMGGMLVLLVRMFQSSPPSTSAPTANFTQLS